MEDSGMRDERAKVLMDSLASEMEGKMVVSLDTVDWAEVSNSMKFVALLCLALGRAVQKKPIEDLFGRLWNLKEPATFWKVDREILLVHFASEEDQSKALNGGPWSYEGSAIIMQKWNPGMTEDDFKNKKVKHMGSDEEIAI